MKKSAALQLTAITHGTDSINATTQAIAAHGIALVTRFPADTDQFLSFLLNFGEPLHYYGDSAGTHPSSGAIWRIKYDAEQAARHETHALDGPLLPHSSQSLRDPRPPYFCMLMVNQGWLDQPPGQTGASLFVRWSEALESLHATSPSSYAEIIASLTGHVPHPDGTTRPVVYPLSSPRNPYDMGVRLKSDLLDYLRTHKPEDPSIHAVEALSTAALEVAHCVQLHSGDLVLLDNDRFGHGRESVIGQREGASHEQEINPRELWSVTLG